MKPSQPAAARYAISAVFFVFGALVGAWLPHIPDVKIALGIPNAKLGLALLASGFGAISVMPFTGGLIHRFGSRHVSLVAGALACLCVPPLVSERSLPALVGNLYCLGICYGCLDVGMNAHSVEVQTRHDRPILSSVHGFFSIGGFAGSAGAALADKLGLSNSVHLWLNSFVMLVLVGASARYLLPADVDRRAEGPKFVLPRGVLLLLGIMCVCAFVCEGGLLDWTALYVRSSLAGSTELGAIGAGMVSFGMASGRFGGDVTIRRFGSLRVLVLSGLIAAGGILLGTNVHTPVACIVCFTVAMLGVANMVPILFMVAGTVPGVPTGAGLAAVTICGYAGFLMGPPVIGYVADLRTLAFSLGTLSALGLLVSALSPLAFRDVARPKGA